MQKRRHWTKLFESLLFVFETSDGCVAEIRVCSSHAALAPKYIRHSSISTSKWSTIARCRVWFYPIQKVMFGKYLLPKSCFAFRFIYFTWFIVLIISSVTLHLRVALVHIGDYYCWFAPRLYFCHSSASRPVHYGTERSWWCIFEGHCQLFVAPPFPFDISTYSIIFITSKSVSSFSGALPSCSSPFVI